MARMRTRIVRSVLVLSCAIAALAGAETARADGTPGDVRYTQAFASAGYAQQLMLGPGFTVYRSPSGDPRYSQRITVTAYAWRWNGSNWGSQPAGSQEQSFTTSYGATFALPSIFVGNGAYTLTLLITWKYTNGAPIASEPVLYNATSDYQCMWSTGTCYAGLGGGTAYVYLQGV